MSASKIYIDPNEDIVFAVSKLNRAPAAKVVLIVPNNANIIASQVSTKLLARTVAATDKLVVVVTEDELGRRFAEKAGIVTDTKVSNITNEHWEKAHNIKRQVIAAKDQKKAELMAQVKGDDFVIVDKPATTEANTQAKPNEVVAPVVPPIPAATSAVPAPAPLPALPVNASSEVKPPEVKPLFKKLEPKLIDLGDYALISGGDIADEEEALELREKLLAMKTEQPAASLPKVETTPVEMLAPVTASLKPGSGTGAILAAETAPIEPAGAKFAKSVASLRASLSKQSKQIAAKARQYKESYQQKLAAKRAERDMVNQTEPPAQASLAVDVAPSRAIATREANLPAVAEPKATAVVKSYPASGTGHSLTNANFARGYHHLERPRDLPARRRGTVVTGPTGAAGLGAKLAPANVQAKKLWAKFKSGSNRRKAITGVAILFFVVIFMSILISPKAEVTLNLKQQSIPVSQEVTAVEGLPTVDTDQLQIPLRYVTKEGSRSETGRATGTGETGDRAKGKATIFNYLPNELDVKAGTQITYPTKQLQYVITSSVKIPSLKLAEVEIEAAGFGEKYNLSKGGKYFNYPGYNTTDVSVSTGYEVAGGTSRETKVVAQGDIDGLKTELVNVLKQQLATDIDSLISASEVKLTSDISYNEAKVETNKKAGEEAESFDMTVTMQAKVAVIDKKHLEEVALKLVEQNSTIGGELEVEELQDPVIANVKQEGNKATFSISAAATVTAGITADDVKSQILGMNVSSAEAKLNDMENIEAAKLSYSPGYMPGFLKKLPQDTEKIEVTIQK